MVPLTDAWAQRQFVICHRTDGSVSATTRLLVEALRVAAAVVLVVAPAAVAALVRALDRAQGFRRSLSRRPSRATRYKAARPCRRMSNR